MDRDVHNLGSAEIVWKDLLPYIKWRDAKDLYDELQHLKAELSTQRLATERLAEELRIALNDSKFWKWVSENNNGWKVYTESELRKGYQKLKG